MGGRKGSIEQVSTLTPEQQALFSKMMGDFDPSSLEQMFQTSVADPARQQFQQQTIPGIQERFISGGGARSGAMNRAAVGAGSQLESGLSGQLAQLLANAEQAQLGRQTQLATTPTMETYQQQSSNPLGSLLAPIAQGAGAAAGVGGVASLLSGKNDNKQSSASGTSQGGSTLQDIRNMIFGR